MRLIVTLIIFLFMSGESHAQLDNIYDQKIVEGSVRSFNPLNREKIVNKVAYPLRRQYPIPPIQNREELLERFDEVFDAELIARIRHFNSLEDWSFMGWRGIVSDMGELWIDSEGRLTAVNHQSQIEKRKLQELVSSDRKKVHPALQDFMDPVLMAHTSGFRIRIDQMQDKFYRYASWKATASMSTKPDIVLGKGLRTFDGSGGNHEYTFLNGNYSYTCSIEVMGEDGSHGKLIVRKNGQTVLIQEFETLHN